MAPPEWAYQVENFVTKPDEELVCSICHAIFCEPVSCPCDHVFCQVCITQWLQNNRNCPICRKRVLRFTTMQVVPIIKNLIMKLKLNCQNKEHGCDTQFTLAASESHMKECGFKLLKCKNKPCKEKLFRKDIVEHETNGCPHRYIKCKSCGSKMLSLSSPRDHDCKKSLLLRLRRTQNMLRKKNNKIKELKNQIKSLKDAARNSTNSEPRLQLFSMPPEDRMSVAFMPHSSFFQTLGSNSFNRRIETSFIPESSFSYDDDDDADL